MCRVLKSLIIWGGICWKVDEVLLFDFGMREIRACLTPPCLLGGCFRFASHTRTWVFQLRKSHLYLLTWWGVPFARQVAFFFVCVINVQHASSASPLFHCCMSVCCGRPSIDRKWSLHLHHCLLVHSQGVLYPLERNKCQVPHWTQVLGARSMISRVSNSSVHVL